MPTLLPSGRRAAIAVAATAAALAGGVVAAQPALADNATTLTVVGTSDVFDSNLVQSVIKPDFEAAYPGVTLNYISKGTGAAIQYAEQGSASALLVHAASLENQFVDQGYSAEPAGRAAFWGDYVLLSQRADPANILATRPHDIAGAYQKIAAAGAAGNANFVSRGGTPGTTVQEHAIWALTTGVKTCKVSDANGGGASPSTTTGDCPTNISYPSWYHATGLTQGPNITNADACNYTGGNCYVFTDRGTFTYLRSTGAAQSLKIVTRDNSSRAPGGIEALVNSFHAYAINADKFADNPNVQINQTAAINFLNFLQSRAEQKAIGNYLSPSDPPFIPDALPRVTTSGPAAKVTGSRTLTVTGKISNVVPGTPPLANEPVTLYGDDNANPTQTTQIATATTDSQGRYIFRFFPTASRTYSVHTDQITQLEKPDLNPPFSDILAPSSGPAGSNEVTGLPTITRSLLKNGVLTVSGVVSPLPTDNTGTVTLFASKDDGDVMKLGQPIALNTGQKSFTGRFPVSSGSYTYFVTYDDSPYVSPGDSASKTIDVP